MIASWVATDTTERRLRLRTAIERMSAAILAGECEPPTVDDLRALAELCNEHFLPVEAARVRRWMAS